MKVETLLRALNAVRDKIEAADNAAIDWLAERDKRRRQEAAFLRGIVRAEGSQRAAAEVTGIPQRTISRTLDPEGHAKHRAEYHAAQSARTGPETDHEETVSRNTERQERIRQAIQANPDLSGRKIAALVGVDEKAVRTLKHKLQRAEGEKNAEEILRPDNVVPMRRRRPDWKPRDPRTPEMLKWFNQFLGWTPWAQQTASAMIFNAGGRLPDEAYYPDPSARIG